MAFDKRAMVLVMVAHIMAAMQLTVAVVYKVGDSTGWTTLGNYDYKGWAASKNFQVGDIIVFEYNTQFHNVLQVTHDQYRDCNISTPLVTHTTGNDSFTIKKSGHFYFLCGIPGHCQSGQKVDIRVASKTAPSPGGAAMSPTGGAISPGGAAMSPGGADMSPGGAAAAMPPSPSTSESNAPAPSVSSPLPSKGAFGFAAVTVAIFAGVVAY